MKNPVARHARQFNKAHVHKDKKKDKKKGYMKHKKAPFPDREGAFSLLGRKPVETRSEYSISPITHLFWRHLEIISQFKLIIKSSAYFRVS